MENEIIFATAVMLLAGLLLGRLGKLVKLPNVTGYLVAGLLLGPAVFNVISQEMVDGFAVISDIALGFIAFSVGTGFSLNYFRRVGAAPIIIACFESFGAILLVAVVLILLGFDLKLSIMLGAIAAATAPAQTIMVINQYKAKGPLTSMLLSVVAIDDATALIGFGFASTIVNAMSSTDTNILLSVLSPFYELLISVIIGAAISLIMKFILRYFHKHSNRLCIIIFCVLFCYWLSEMLGGSALLTCMTLGAFLVNIYDEIEDIVEVCDTFTPPVYMIFFVISGAGFQLSALASIGIIGILYVVLRVIGKMVGSWLGGRLTHQDAKINKYLGPTLMPQAGVALGLVVVAATAVPQYADQIRTIILCSTFIYSIIGPIAAKLALQKAGEIRIEKKEASLSR